MSVLNLILLIIILCFVAWEVCVFILVRTTTFTWHDPHTLSRIIWKLENRFGWPVRLTVGLAIATLFFHLVFQIP